MMVDPINTLLGFMDEPLAVKFTNILTARASQISMQAIFLAIKDKDPGFMQDVSMFFDKVMDYG